MKTLHSSSMQYGPLPAPSLFSSGFLTTSPSLGAAVTLAVLGIIRDRPIGLTWTIAQKPLGLKTARFNVTLGAHPDLELSCPGKCYGQQDVSASFGLMVFGVTKPLCDSASKVSTHWPEAYLCHPLLGPSQSSSTVPKIGSQNSLETQRPQMFIMLPSKRVKLFQLVVQSLHLPTRSY